MLLNAGHHQKSQVYWFTKYTELFNPKCTYLIPEDEKRESRDGLRERTEEEEVKRCMMLKRERNKDFGVEWEMKREKESKE